MSSDWDTLRRDTETIGHSLAELRADLATLGVSDRQSAVARTELASADDSPFQLLLSALDAFPGLVGYLQGRRGSGDFIQVAHEADVQDLLFISIKPMLPELVYEQPTRKGAASYSVGDFSLPSMKLILEVKLVKNRSDVKAKANEIAQDIWQYVNRTDCQRILFFVYDPNLVIPDREAFVRESSGMFTSLGREVQLHTVIKP